MSQLFTLDGELLSLAARESSRLPLNDGPFRPTTTQDGANMSISIHPDAPLNVHKFFQETTGGTIMPFQFIEDDIRTQGNPRWEDYETQARSEPFVGYAGGDAEVVSLSLAFASSVEQSDGGREFTAKRCAQWLQALRLPVTRNDVTYPPPLLMLVIGKTISMRCVLSSLSVSYVAPFLGGLGEYPSIVKCEVDFREVRRNARTAYDVLTGA